MRVRHRAHAVHVRHDPDRRCRRGTLRPRLLARTVDIRSLGPMSPSGFTCASASGSPAKRSRATGRSSRGSWSSARPARSRFSDATAWTRRACCASTRQASGSSAIAASRARSNSRADKFEQYLREEGLERIIEERAARKETPAAGTRALLAERQVAPALRRRPDGSRVRPRARPDARVRARRRSYARDRRSRAGAASARDGRPLAGALVVAYRRDTATFPGQPVRAKQARVAKQRAGSKRKQRSAACPHRQGRSGRSASDERRVAAQVGAHGTCCRRQRR